MKKLLVILGGVVLTALVVLILASSSTVIQVDPPVRVVGGETPVRVVLSNPRGVRRFQATLEQGSGRWVVHDWSQAASRFGFWGRNEAPREVRFPAGKSRAPALTSGKARLILAAQSNDLRGAWTSLALDLEVKLEPPAVTADSAQHYINQGGAELVTYTVSGYWTDAGVRVGKHTFRSFPLPGRPEAERFALFAFSWDTPADTVPLVYARNDAGAEVTARFWFKVFPKRFRQRAIELNNAFLQKVTAEIDPGGAGDLLSRFLKINGPLRLANNQALADLRLKTADRFLWSGPFLQLANSKVESQFADTRDYVYQGKKIDRQTHLGFDLSVTRNVPVPAANDGAVVLAQRLGIYGNTVVVDHGYGLQSIYAHLNEIDVQPGETVKKGQTLGNSGATGLAGGDHLHFSMQVDGVQVNPVEWWDEHWLQDRIWSKVPGR